MATEPRFDNVLGAMQRWFNLAVARIAALSFWQFVLLAIILLIAAGITESFWEKPVKRRVHISDQLSAAKRDIAKAKKKAVESAEIQIDENGVRIRSKPADTDTPPPPAAPAEADKPAPASPGPGGVPEEKDGSASVASPKPDKEINIGKGMVVIRKHGASDAAGNAKGSSEIQVQVPDIKLSEEDLADLADLEDINVNVSARHPPLASLAFLLVLVLFVMRMFARAKQKTDAAVATADRETLQRQVVEARLQLLQAQVEPHFLFNTLAAVEYLIETAPARAAQMQRHLIEYLRAALPRMRQQSATLGQEVELCASYLKIMQMRMEERLQFDVAVPVGLSSATFPPMMIQSLVENAIQHGLEPKPEGGSVHLHAEVRDGKLFVTVEDTGMGFSKDAGAGIGLANIRERLQQLFGAAGALTIEPNQPNGTRATITVPYAVA